MIIDAKERRRFQAKVVPDGHGCLIWTGYKSPDGYGRFRATRNGKSTAQMAHRIAFEHAFGEIPPGLQVDHTCLNRACVNPDHFRLVTNKQNCEHRGPRRGSKSGVRGVSWSGGKWHVVVTHYGKFHSGGKFDDLAEAEQAAIELRKSLFTHNLSDRQSVA